jgi:peptidoglycan/LPS O-acetylase OafA/YrhL
MQLSMLGLNMPSTGDLLVAPSWTLGVELAFYALAPFVLRLKDRHLACLMALGVALRFMPYNTHLPLLAGIEMFCLGAWVQRHGHAWFWPDRIMRKLGLLGVSLVLVLVLTFTLPPYELVSIPKTHNELDVLVYPLVFAVFIPALFRATMHSAIDRHIGELSYPFYIFHALVIDLLRGQGWWSGLSTDAGLALAAVVCTLVAATVFHQLESRFIEPYRQRLSKPLNKAVQSVPVDSAAEIRRAA